MKQQPLLTFLLAVVVGLSVQFRNSNAATLSFNGKGGSVVGSTVEQGFKYSALSGGLWRSDHEGSPAPDLESDALADCPACASGFGGVVQVVTVNGADFLFESVDIAKTSIRGNQFAGPQSIKFTGFWQGSVVGVDQFTTSAENFVWTTQAPVEIKDLILDELQIRLEGIETPVEFGFLAIDSLVVTAVPEPSTLGAMFIAIGLFFTAPSRRKLIGGK